jgi:hypothetical protein
LPTLSCAVMSEGHLPCTGSELGGGAPLSCFKRACSPPRTPFSRGDSLRAGFQPVRSSAHVSTMASAVMRANHWGALSSTTPGSACRVSTLPWSITPIQFVPPAMHPVLATSVPPAVQPIRSASTSVPPGHGTGLRKNFHHALTARRTLPRSLNNL